MIKEFKYLKVGDVILFRGKVLQVMSTEPLYPVFLNLETREEESFLTFPDKVMKILKQGTLPQNREHTTTCRKCNCEFIFTEDEGRVVHDFRDGDSLVVKCPMTDCGNEIWILKK